VHVVRKVGCSRSQETSNAGMFADCSVDVIIVKMWLENIGIFCRKRMPNSSELRFS